MFERRCIVHVCIFRIATLSYYTVRTVVYTVELDLPIMVDIPIVYY